MAGFMARRIGSVGLLLACLACAHQAASTPVPPSGTGRTITLGELQSSLSHQRPCTVVFDIDDTTLYTGLAFLFAQGYLEERDAGKFREDRAFWTLINDSLDARFSKPKRIAQQLIAFHQARGDTIVFVTSRLPERARQRQDQPAAAAALRVSLAADGPLHGAAAQDGGHPVGAPRAFLRRLGRRHREHPRSRFLDPRDPHHPESRELQSGRPCSRASTVKRFSPTRRTSAA